ncbi:hypothetical protein [Desulfosporosinus sp. SB140]|uniref:hypothetical protein n=1 Tax=Desulfosporosinus paludis TaxID=3115649 RepID=UPI00388D9C20
MSWDGGLQVFGWHENGDPISLDAMIFDNIPIDDLAEIDSAIAKAQGGETT